MEVCGGVRVEILLLIDFKRNEIDLVWGKSYLEPDREMSKTSFKVLLGGNIVHPGIVGSNPFQLLCTWEQLHLFYNIAFVQL